MGKGLKNSFNNKKALIIVETPLQLLCAYEAIYFFNLKYELYIRLIDNETSNKQLKYIVSKLNFKNVNYIELSGNKTLINKLKIITQIVFLKSKRTDIYVIGDYLSGFLNLFIKTVNRKKVILLDDGVATFKIQKILRNKKKLISLFTMFDIKSIENQYIYKNDFKCIKLKYNTIKKIDYNIFIGGKLVDLNLVDIKTYLAIITDAASKNSNKLIYIPHRGTSKDVLNNISKIKNLTIKPIDTSIEFYLLEKGISPTHVYSVVSTALFTLSMIFKDSFVISYKPKFLENNRQEHIEDVYNKIEKQKKITINKFTLKD